MKSSKPASRMSPTTTRRAFLYGMAAATAAAAYPFLGEAHWLEVTRTPLRLTRTPMRRPVRILHLSDLHASLPVPMSLIRRAVALGLEQKPDFVCLTGDFITSMFTGWDEYADALAPLARHAPTFAVKGNHDSGPWTIPADGNRSHDESMISRFLKKAGARVLSGESEVLRLPGQEINIVGIGDYWTYRNCPSDAFSELTEADYASRPTIALAHNPDSKAMCKAYPWDLMLCGHTHGGQILLPWLPPLKLPIRDRSCYTGLNKYDGRHVYITRGVGSLGGMRLNCRPEVSIIELS